MKSAVYCEHANETPVYVNVDDKLVCGCPEDCYCKHEGGCKILRFCSPGLRFVVKDDRVVACCTTDEAMEAARRLMSL